jgi:hypothetical protein
MSVGSLPGGSAEDRNRSEAPEPERRRAEPVRSGDDRSPAVMAPGQSEVTAGQGPHVVATGQGPRDPSDPTRVVGEVECPRCGTWVDLIEDADEVEYDGTVPEGGWSGVATAEHCGLLIADWWDGTHVFDLETS